MSDVDRYLDPLLAELRDSAADVRRVLAEVEDHLRDAVRAGAAIGLPEDEAEARAVERFGAERGSPRRPWPRSTRGRPGAVRKIYNVKAATG